MTNLFSKGEYSKVGNTFFNNNGVKYLIAERKNTTPNKPKNFIIAKTESKDYYISSLYDTVTLNSFNADYRGHKYSVLISSDNVVIKEREGSQL